MVHLLAQAHAGISTWSSPQAAPDLRTNARMLGVFACFKMGLDAPGVLKWFQGLLNRDSQGFRPRSLYRIVSALLKRSYGATMMASMTVSIKLSGVPQNHPHRRSSFKREEEPSK